MIPLLRFKEFTNTWSKDKLKTLIKICYGKSQSEVENSFGKYPILGSGGIIGKSNSYLYNEPSVLIGRKGTIDKPMYFDTPFWTVDTLFYTKILGNNNPKFIYYLFNTIQWKTYSEQSGVPSLAGTVIEGIEKYYPSIPEQNKIATFLNLYYKKIDLQKRKIELLNILFNNLIADEYKIIENSNNLSVKLKDILISGDKTAVLDTSKYKKINIKLNKQGINYANISRQMTDSRPFYIRRKNELIIGKQNYFNGSISIVPDCFDGCICSNAIMSFKCGDKALTDFIYYYISMPSYIKKREQYANGTGQKELSEKDFLNFDINLPSINEQFNIISKIRVLNLKQNLEQKKLKLLEKYKQGLLQQLFI